MRTLATALGAVLVLPGLAYAASTSKDDTSAKQASLCEVMIDRTSRRMTDDGMAKSTAKAEMAELTGEQKQAVKAALDAARQLGDSDRRGCMAMVQAARTVLAHGEAMSAHDRKMKTLEEWNEKTLYENSWRAEALIDQTAYDAKGEVVGEVHDIVMTPDGKVTGLIIEGGGILDIGDTHARVNWSDVKLRSGEEGGVVVPLAKDKMTDFSLFSDDQDKPGVAGETVADDEIRMSLMLNRRMRFRTGEPYGYVDDILVSNGKVEAILVRPDLNYEGYRPRPYAMPYSAYDYGYNTAYDFYVMPYDRSELSDLSGFDIQKIKGPSAASEPDKGS